MQLKTQLATAVQHAVRTLSPSGSPVEVVIQETPSDKPGDYGTAVAFQLAKTIGASPALIARQLAATIVLPQFIARVEALGPYLNFFVEAGSFIRAIVEEEPASAPKRGKVVIEHTSINPNKELHVGHFRNVVLGDSMARIFKAAGHMVEVQNYIDDTGRQTAESLFAVEHYALTWNQTTKYDHWLGEGYVCLNADPNKAAFEPGIRALMHRLDAGALRQEVEQVVHAHLATCFRIGARYDLLTWESDVVGSGFLAHTMAILKASRYVSHPAEGKYAGAWVMNVSEFMPGLEEPNVVLMRSDGTAMYTAKDIGLQFWKFGLVEGMKFKPFAVDPEGQPVWSSDPNGDADGQRRFGHADEVINVIDSRQAHPQTVVKSALGVAGAPDQQANSTHLAYAFVTLNGQTISGRQGDTVSADEALDEAERRAMHLLHEINPELAARADAKDIARIIGIGAIRFTMLKADPNRQIDFQWEEALRLNGDTAPYVQYAAVRAGTIVLKAAQQGFAVGGPTATWSELPDADLTLAKQIAKRDAIVDQCVRSHSPHPLAQYALDLGTAFNAWYNARSADGTPLTNVLKSQPGVRAARLALMAKLKRHIAETLLMLGIEVPVAM